VGISTSAIFKPPQIVTYNFKFERGKVPFAVVGDAYSNGYDVTTFFLSFADDVDLSVGDVIYVCDMTFDYSSWCGDKLRVDFNNQYYTITKVTANIDAETIDIEFIHGKDVVGNCGGTYMSGGNVVRKTDIGGEQFTTIQNSSYDHVHNIISHEPHIETDISEEKLREVLTPEFVSYKKPKLKITNPDNCSESKRVSETINTYEKEILLENLNRYGEVGSVLATYSYEIPFNFVQKLKTAKDVPSSPTLDVRMENEIFKVKCSSSTHSRSVILDASEKKYENIVYGPDEHGYVLTLTASWSTAPDKVVHPRGIDYDVDVGDTIEVIFREGSHLWIERGLKIIENGKVVAIRKTPTGKVITVNYGKNNNLEEELALEETHIYSLRIVSSTEINQTVKKIKFSEAYSEKLRGTAEQNIYPEGYFRHIPISIDSSIFVDIETPFEYYNIQDIGNTNAKLAEGKSPQHRSYFRNVFSALPKKQPYNEKFRRSVNSYRTTVSATGNADNTPPIVRIRKPAIQTSIGDSFWYLDDTPVTLDLADDTNTLRSGDVELSKDLQLHYTFETEEFDTEVLDMSDNNRHGEKNSVLIRDGGESRLYRKVLSLDNDVKTNEENTKSYLSVTEGDGYIKTNKATISFWIRPLGVSEENVGIVFNNSSEENNRHGVVMNPNGNSFSLGYSWKNSVDSYNVDLGTPINHDKWSHVVILIYGEGVVRVFVNKWFVRNYDLGVEHEEVTFDNLEIGRVSGMIDDIRFYDEILDYGEIQLNKEAGGQVADLYDTTRREHPVDPTTDEWCGLDEFDFMYYQGVDFVEANRVYRENPATTENILADPELEARRKFDRVGGINDGDPKYATSDFMGNLCGILKDTD
jgi:hypothetical protein